MPYVTSIERRGIQQGLQQGLIQNSREATVEILEARFGAVPSSMAEVIYRIEDLSRLKRLLKRAATVASLDEFKAALEEE